MKEQLCKALFLYTKKKSADLRGQILWIFYGMIFLSCLTHYVLMCTSCSDLCLISQLCVSILLSRHHHWAFFFYCYYLSLVKFICPFAQIELPKYFTMCSDMNFLSRLPLPFLCPPIRLQGYRILRSHDHQPIPSPAPPDVLLPSRRCLTSAV